MEGEVQQTGTSKSGRVRKKSAKVLEMEAAEELEKKNLVASTKKTKQKIFMESSPVAKREGTNFSQMCADGSSVIKHLLSTPSPDKTGTPMSKVSPEAEMEILTDTSSNKKSDTGKIIDDTNSGPVTPLSATVDLLRNRLEKAEGVDDLKLCLSVQSLGGKGSEQVKEKSSKKKAKDTSSLPSSSRPKEFPGNVTVQTDYESGLKLKLVLSPKESSVSKEQVGLGHERSSKESSKRKKAKNDSDVRAKKIRLKNTLDGSSVYSHRIKNEPDAPNSSKKKKKKDPSEKGRHPVVTQRLNQQQTVLTKVLASPVIPQDGAIPYTSMDSDVQVDSNLVISEDVKVKPKKTNIKKVKSKAKAVVEGVLISGPGNILESTEEIPVYSDTHEMALKLQTSKEKKMNKKAKLRKGDPDKPKRRRGLTAYMMWCNSYRNKVISENPGIDFAQMSKRLGEIWQSLPSKDKMGWKRKAKRFNAKSGSSLISTGKSVLTKSGQIKPSTDSIPEALSSRVSSKNSVIPASATKPSNKLPENVSTSPTKSACGTSALDVAAHLKLIGESLSIIGTRLQEHQGQIAVQGSLSVLLDSLLCTLGPLSCMTSFVPELDGCPTATHSSTLDNIAYIMPGL